MNLIVTLLHIILNRPEIIVTLKNNRHFKQGNGQTTADNGHF